MVLIQAGAGSGKINRLVDDLGGIVYGGQLEHGCFGDVTVIAGFPLVVLLDQARPGQAQQCSGAGNHTTQRDVTPY